LLDKDQKGYLTKEDLLRVLNTASVEDNLVQNNANNSGESSVSSKCKTNEAERLHRLEERVKGIMQMADINMDGVIR
jgi:Ca2+-binding EF-hand superfamily protein